MRTLFSRELKPLLDAIAGQMDLYIPRKTGLHYVYNRYDPSDDNQVEVNNIRVCTPTKEFLFPLRELAAIFPEPLELKEIEPFAVFGLKDCDLRSIEILDKVFAEDEFEDPFYVKRREKMFIISSDCSNPAESCFCNILNGRPFAENGFDLNVSKLKAGFVVEVGSTKGDEFVKANAELFSKAGEDVLAERERGSMHQLTRLWKTGRIPISLTRRPKLVSSARPARGSARPVIVSISMTRKRKTTSAR